MSYHTTDNAASYHYFPSQHASLNDPSSSSQPTGTSEIPAIRPASQRFCCPIETYHPDRDEFYCGVPGLKSREGGFENISRLKSHILHNHSEQYVCRNFGRPIKRNTSEKHEKKECNFSDVKCLLSLEDTDRLRGISSGDKTAWSKFQKLLVPNPQKDFPLQPWYVPPKKRRYLPPPGLMDPSAFNELDPGLYSVGDWINDPAFSWQGIGNGGK